MAYGGTDSSNGTYGPVGASTATSEPQPVQNQGPAGPAGPAGPPGPNIDRYAATRIVSADPNQGTDTTIQAAIDNLPSSGGTIFLKDPLYQISAPLVMPDKDVVFVVAAGTKLVPVGNIALFAVPDGLTDVRTYQVIGAPILEGDSAADQAVFQLDDANGYGNFELRDALVTGFATFTNWLKHGDFSRQTNVRTYNSVLRCLETADSILAKTPVPGGTYASAAALRFFETDIEGNFDATPYRGWKADADIDLWLTRCSYVNLVAEGLTNIDGLAQEASGIRVIGSGDMTFNGNAWDAWDHIDGGSSCFSQHRTLNTNADARMVFLTGIAKIALGATTCVAFRIQGIVDFSCGEMGDSIGLSNPGVEIAASGANQYGSVVRNTTFRKPFGSPPSVFGQGCIKITNTLTTKVHECDFKTTVTGKTVLETGTSDKNCIHDNTGFASGTGNTVNINGNDQVHNNIN